MISLIRASWQEELRVPMFVGLSTDGYPASTDPAVKNGARIYHMDTGKEYEYSISGNNWYEVPSGGAGVTNGYYYNGQFYNNVQHTQLITPTEGGLYFNKTDKLLYIYNGVSYAEVGAGAQVGRFLTGWDATTGQPTTQPPVLPYNFVTGDFFIVDVVASAGGTNYRPSGTSYDGTASSVVETDAVNVGDFYFFESTNWVHIQNTAKVNDVQVNGTSILNNGIANIIRDSAPTKNSNNFVTSGGVYNGLSTKQDTISDLATIRSGAAAGATALQPPLVKTIMDAVAVAGARYYLGEQTAVSITMPTDALLGQEIVVNFSSGATACSLTCDLTGFDFTPKANTTNKITFTLISKGATAAGDKWSVEIEEG